MRHIFLILSVLALSACSTFQGYVERSAITKPVLSFQEFADADKASFQRVDHSPLDRFLSKYLVTTEPDHPIGLGANFIRYQEVTAQDKQQLDAYIDSLQATQVSALNRNEQLAFWINLYNAETIRRVIENAPVASIRSIQSSPLDLKGPWNDVRLNVEGTDLSLDQIENNIVRPVFSDPRIHYGLNCAAIGCPNLRAQAYKGVSVEASLDEQARKFINTERGVKIENGKVTASRIFLWYDIDYGESEADVLNHIRQYASPDLKKALTGVTDISGYDYDWDINDAANLTAPSGS